VVAAVVVFAVAFTLGALGMKTAVLSEEKTAESGMLASRVTALTSERFVTLRCRMTPTAKASKPQPTRIYFR